LVSLHAVMLVTFGSTDCEDGALKYRTERLSMNNVAEALSNVTVVSASSLKDNEGGVMSFIYLCLSLLSWTHNSHENRPLGLCLGYRYLDILLYFSVHNLVSFNWFPGMILCIYVRMYAYFVDTLMHLDHSRGGAVGWGTALLTGRSRVRFPILSLDFFIDINPSGPTMALGLTQPLTEMSTRNISWG